MKDKEIYVLGVGHNTPVMIDHAMACGYRVAGLYHYAEGRTGEIDHGYEILGSFSDLFSKPTLQGMRFLLSMGDIQIRKELFEKILSKGGELPNLIHPTSVLSSFAKIGENGVMIFPFTFIESDSFVDDNCVLLSHVDISHNTTLGKHCFVGTGSVIGAYTTVEDEVFFGLGALTISQKVKNIGKRAFIGARSLVTRSIEAGTVVVGSPARVLS